VTNIVRFPPLPPIPAPPRTARDERQASFGELVGALAGSLDGAAGAVRVANVSTGFAAAAVDLGALQDMLALAIEQLSMSEVRERWSDDLRTWFARALMTWVQRCKEIRFHVEGTGVRIEMETQDDRGYYRYEFAVFPGRRSDS
jgi:hypothetical protein